MTADNPADSINKTNQRLENKNVKIFAIAFCVLAGLMLLAEIGKRNEPQQASPSSAPKPECCLVRYEVTGRSEHGSLTFQNADGGTSQISKAKLPWTLDFKSKPGAFLYISAQEQSGNEKSAITATIYIDGFKFKSSSSSGAYVIASTSGSVPKP